MKQENEMKIHLLSQTSLLPQWSSLLGDKYSHALPFKWGFTGSPEEADVMVWDGSMNAKSAHYYVGPLESLKGGRPLLLLTSEARTLFKNHPYAREFDLSGVNTVELPGGNVLPEDLLALLEECHKKLNHV